MKVRPCSNRRKEKECHPPEKKRVHFQSDEARSGGEEPPCMMRGGSFFCSLNPQSPYSNQPASSAGCPHGVSSLATAVFEADHAVLCIASVVSVSTVSLRAECVRQSMSDTADPAASLNPKPHPVFPERTTDDYFGFSCLSAGERGGAGC